MLRVVVCLIVVNIIKTNEVIRKEYLPICENFSVKVYKLTDPGCCKSYNSTQVIYPVDPSLQTKVSCFNIIDMNKFKLKSFKSLYFSLKLFSEVCLLMLFSVMFSINVLLF